MRSFILLSAAAALTLASPVPQELDFSLIDTVETPSNVTVPTNTNELIVSYDSDAAAAAVQTSVLTGQTEIDISNSTTNSTSSSTLRRRGTCAVQASGSGPVPSPDTASSFLSYSAFASAASAAATPSGYTQAFKNLNASNNAYGYLGFTNLASYDSEKCASKCNAISGCASFNLYFERDPSKDPGTGCEDPSSTTNIKCVFWGGPLTTANANNAGQYRSKFQVVIAGSNGYVNNTIEPADGFTSPSYYGNTAIDAPNDCNDKSTFLGSQVFTGGPFDANLCAAACNAQSATNLKANKPTCKFFNTYILSRNNVAIGQYCNLYSQTWASSYATYKGSNSGGNKYTVSYSYGFSSSADAGTCKKPTTSTWVISSATATASSTATAQPTTSGGFINWKTFQANGANLGGWLEKEQTHDPIWWASVANLSTTPDEWTLCQTLGDQCGPTLEARYASFLNHSTIDQLASVGVNTLRIPTTYAAWVNVPGSALYHGNQQQYLKAITDYAINTYGMHIIVGLHSLPGGVNNLDIGEALMHDDFFYNTTNLNYAYEAVDAILDFIKASGNMTSWTIGPINEASDNLPGFGTSAGLTDKGAQWVADYINGVVSRTAKVDSRIPVMVQDCFKGASFWEPYFDASANLVIDSHVYYFAAAGTYSQFVAPAVCGQAAFIAESSKFPNFIGEWSLQTMYNNSLAVSTRQEIFNTQRYAWSKYVSGGSFWTAVSYSTALVDGEGTQRDYWSYIDLINEGVIKPESAFNGTAYC
ncbi:glycoside hydrolase [Aureobasidium subglaciale]|nr:glycoside hydrolase [Aureobasidium subglaciale]